MTNLAVRPRFETDTRRRYTADGPIDFETWLDFSFEMDAIGRRLDTELIKGVMVERMSAQYPHEWIFMWLGRFIGLYVEERELGIVLGSRTAVRITNLDGRLPDILFVRAENRHIVQDRAIYGVPDLVIEIVSPNDRRGELLALEADYRKIGIPEIVFLYPKKKHVRYLRKTGDAYDETLLKTSDLKFDCIPGFRVEVKSIFAADKPKVLSLVQELIAEAEAEAREQE